MPHLKQLVLDANTLALQLGHFQSPSRCRHTHTHTHTHTNTYGSVKTPVTPMCTAHAYTVARVNQPTHTIRSNNSNTLATRSRTHGAKPKLYLTG